MQKSALQGTLLARKWKQKRNKKEGNTKEVARKHGRSGKEMRRKQKGNTKEVERKEGRREICQQGGGGRSWLPNWVLAGQEIQETINCFQFFKNYFAKMQTLTTWPTFKFCPQKRNIQTAKVRVVFKTICSRKWLDWPIGPVGQKYIQGTASLHHRSSPFSFLTLEIKKLENKKKIESFLLFYSAAPTVAICIFNAMKYEI